jgi:GT2 family glycosyltransferase
VLRLSIIIVTWNSRRDVEACLRSLGPMPADCELWIVDNASSDGTAELLRSQFPRVRLIANAENVGFSRANNQALKLASGKYILLLNPDTELSITAIETAIAELESRPRAGMLAVQLRNTDGSLQTSCFRFPRLSTALLNALGLQLLLPKPYRARRLLGRWAHDEPRPVDWVLGAFMLVRREAVDKVGPLPEEYEIFTEDMEWCYRFSQAGYEVWFSPAASITHHGNRSGASQPPNWRVQLTHHGKYEFCRRHYGGLTARLILICDLLAYTLRHWRYAVQAAMGSGQEYIRDLMAAGRRATWNELRGRGHGRIAG